MKKTLYIFPFLLLVFTSLAGQVKNQQTHQSDIIIEGKATDQELILDPDKRQTLILIISSFASNYTIAPRTTNEFEIGYKAPFRIVLPASNDLIYISFLLKTGKNAKLVAFDNTYILEKGDSIHCELSDLDFKFSGKGAEKLNCQSEIYKHQYRMSDDENDLLSEKRYNEYFFITDKRKDSILNKQLAIVNQYSSKLGKKMTGIMTANCYGLKYYDTFRGYNMFSREPQVQEELLTYLNNSAFKNIQMNLVNQLDYETLTASPIYCNFILEKITLDSNGNFLTPELRIGRIFNSIKNNYEGLLREKLFTLFFLRYKSSSLNYLNEALEYVKNRQYKSILLEIKNLNTRGTPFFPFELQDTKGKTVKLSDLKEKVVILDFWYTGCTWCKALYEGMKPVVNNYKNNPKVEFVSICIDKDKTNWLKSVADGKYCDPDGLNLYTNGLGSKHPVIESNNINQYPTLIILKNGLIYTTTPPKSGPGANNAKANLISLIDGGLISTKI